MFSPAYRVLHTTLGVQRGGSIPLICRSAKTCALGEHLLSVADPSSRLQERLSHVGALIRPPTLHRRPVSGLHSYAAMARAAPPGSPVPEPGRRPGGTSQYRPGCKRYWCRGCKRTFNDLTATLLHRSNRPLSYWIRATVLLCLSCSSRRIARELGLHTRTSYRWCWWLRNTAVAYETDRQLEGTGEADALYHTAGHTGQAPPGGKKAWGRRARGRRKKREPGRGH